MVEIHRAQAVAKTRGALKRRSEWWHQGTQQMRALPHLTVQSVVRLMPNFSASGAARSEATTRRRACHPSGRSPCGGEGGP